MFVGNQLAFEKTYLAAVNKSKFRDPSAWGFLQGWDTFLVYLIEIHQVVQVIFVQVKIIKVTKTSTATIFLNYPKDQ